jgi:hypothetical protein
MRVPGAPFGEEDRSASPQNGTPSPGLILVSESCAAIVCLLASNVASINVNLALFPKHPPLVSPNDDS